MFCCNHCTGKSSPQCGIFCDFALHLVNQNCGRIGHTCMAFLQYVRFSCVSSYGQLWKVTLLTFVRLFSRVDLFVLPHIWQFIWRISTLTALMRLYPCVSHNVGFHSTAQHSTAQQDQMICRIVHNCATYPQNEWPNALSNVQLGRMTCCIVHTYVISFQCESSCGF